LGDDHFVARFKVTRQSLAGQEGQSGHVLTESDLLASVGAGEDRGQVSTALEQLVRDHRGREGPAGIGVVFPLVLGHGFDHRPRCLRAGGAVQEGDRMAIECGRLKGGEVLPARLGLGGAKAGQAEGLFVDGRTDQ